MTSFGVQAQELLPQQVLNEMVASSTYWPKQTATLESFEMPLMLDGKPSGAVKVQAGCALDVVAVKPDGVIVELHGNQTKLAIEKTDLLSRFPERKKEVEKQLQEERLALMAAGEELVVFSAPSANPIEAVEPATQIIYVDSSQPRIQVNAGYYWPYTAYYPYSTSYVIQPYYAPYYCYRPAPLVQYSRPVAQTVSRLGGPVYSKPAATRFAHPFAPARPGP